MNDVIKWGIVLIAVFLLVLLRKRRTKRFDPSGKTRVFAILRKFNQEKYMVLHYVYLPYVDMDGRTIDVGRILRTFKIKKNVEVTYNGKIII